VKNRKMNMGMGIPPRTPTSPFSLNEEIGRGDEEGFGKWRWGWRDLYLSSFSRCSSLETNDIK
jgi:hypothetical protein